MLAQTERMQNENVNTDSFMIQKHLPPQYTELIFYLFFFFWGGVCFFPPGLFMFLSLPFVDLKDQWKVTLQMKMRYQVWNEGNGDSRCDRVIQLRRTPMPAPNTRKLGSLFTNLHSPPGTSGSSDRSE